MSNSPDSKSTGLRRAPSKLTPKGFTLWVTSSWLLSGMQTCAKLARMAGFVIRHCLTSRYVAGFVLAVLLVLAIKGRAGLRQAVATANWQLQVLRSVALVVATFGIFSGVNCLGIGLATALGYSWPALSHIIGWQRWAGFKERPDFQSGMSVLVAFIGIGMLVSLRVHPGTSKNMVLGVAYVGLGALGNALQANLSQKLRAVDPDPYRGLLWLLLVGTCVMLAWNIWIWVLPTEESLPPMKALASVPLAGIAICGMLSQFAMILAVESSPAKKLTPLTSVFQLPFAVMLGHVVFGESWPSFQEGLWMAVIVGAGVVNYLPMPNRGGTPNSLNTP